MSDSAAKVHHILLVEDDPFVAETLTRVLEAKGYRVTWARDGGQAHSLFAMRQPDFVLLDLMLPGESGFEICEHMKKQNETVPILVLTAIDLPDSRELAFRVGADGYLVKPCEPDSLVTEISRIADTVLERRLRKDPSKTADRVRFHCECGRRFKVSASHRGKTMTCPQCGESVTVPLQ